MFQLCPFYITEGEPGTLDRGCRAARDRVGTMRPRITLTMRFATSLIDLLKKDFVFYKDQISTDVVAFMHAFTIAFLVLTIVEEARWGQRWRRLGRRLLVVLCLGYLGICLYRVASYTRSLSVYDHVEASTIAISWLWGHGAPLYHPPDAAPRYSNLYGPAMFIIDALFLDAFGPSVFAAKLAGAVSWAAGVVLLYGTLRREGPPLLALATTTYGVLGLMLASGETSCFNVRAEPHLVFWTCVGLFASGLRSPFWAALGCGVAAGIDVNLKLHAALYALPFFALLWERHGARTVVAAGAIAALVAAGPFVGGRGISLPLYLGRLRGSAHRGLAAESFKGVLAEGTFVALPVVAALAHLALSDRRLWWSFLRPNRALLLALGLAGVLMIVPASKEGAGPHHLMPLYPALALVLCRTLAQPVAPEEARRWQGRLARAVALAFVPMALATTTISHHRIMAWEQLAEAEARKMLAEIEAIQGRFPGKSLAIGYGGNESYQETNLKCVLVLRGQPYLLDSVALMDMQKEGLEISAKTREALRQGLIQVWLIPAGDEPFSVRSFYTTKLPLFDASFRSTFRDHYSRRYRTKHYDVWVYNGPGPTRRGNEP